MKILVDSNLLIDAFPMKEGASTYPDGLANRFLSRANECGHQIFHHPVAFRKDYDRIKNAADREWRRKITNSYPALPNPPSIQDGMKRILGDVEEGGKQWVDRWLLAAAYGHAVSMLVTTDKQMIRHGRLLGLGESVCTPEDALAAIEALEPESAYEALLPEAISCHQLDIDDPIFVSLREDYVGFDGWFKKTQAEHRQGYRLMNDGNLAAVTILKDETPCEFAWRGKTLKICLFKVSEKHAANRYGELLLKPALDYGHKNQFKYAYLTAFLRHKDVIVFMERFGFEKWRDLTELGEIVLRKRLIPEFGENDSPDNWEYHRLYGPHYYALEADRYFVPIEPRFSNRLFPEMSEQAGFRDVGFNVAAGNALDKAYVSGSGIDKIVPGSILYFYRSSDSHTNLEPRLLVVGVVEGVKRSDVSSEIMSFVGRRTVYTEEQIQGIIDSGQHGCLAILFRQAKMVPYGVASNRRLKEANVWVAPPQSITTVNASAAVDWLKREIDAN